MPGRTFPERQFLSKRLLRTLQSPAVSVPQPPGSSHCSFSISSGSSSLPVHLILASQLDGMLLESESLIYSSLHSSKPHVTQEFDIY